MDKINYKEAIDHINDYTKSSFQAVMDGNKLKNNVANFGAKKGDIAKLERTGEYYGIAIEFLEPVRPLLTNYSMLKILHFLQKEDYITILQIYDIDNIEKLWYIIAKWFDVATIEPYEIPYSKKYSEYNNWIETVTHDPLQSKLKIIEIGQNQNTGESVVPEEWQDKIFENAFDIHMAMNKLSTRQNKPPVTYAFIYAMILQKNDTILTNPSTKAKIIIHFTSSFKTTIDSKIKNSYQYIQYDKILIGFRIDDLFKEKKIGAIGNASLLASRLQKCIRRGRYAGKLLTETIEKLNDAPNYNLPEHKFMRVSSTKQLVWRLFISALEDCRPYKNTTELSLFDLIILALITQKCKEFKFNKTLLKQIIKTAINIQFNDTVKDLYKWRNLGELENMKFQHNSKFLSSLYLAVKHIPMMAGDTVMLSKYYSFNDILKPLKQTAETHHDDTVYNDTMLSSIDHHTKPAIILYYQACQNQKLTTKQISNQIWDISSSYNVRINKPLIYDIQLRKIQKYFNEEKKNRNIPTFIPSKIIDIDPNNKIKRITFLILFGTKFKYQNKDVVIAGNQENPIMIKIKNKWTESNEIDILNAFPSKQIKLSHIAPPIGFKWNQKQVHVQIKKGEPYIDNTKVSFFDGSMIISSIVPVVKKNIEDNNINKFFTNTEINFCDIITYKNTSLSELHNWDLQNYNQILIKNVYSKFFTGHENIIVIGPVDRSGSKTENAIDVVYEGRLWAIFNLFCYLYPETFEPNGILNFKINRNTSGYVHVVKLLENLLYSKKPIIQKSLPTISTVLWDHQKESISKIISGFGSMYHGYGDSSNVGSGKTLTALAISSKLITTNTSNYSGILVLIPNNKLIVTWKNEIEKHTKGFDTQYHITGKSPETIRNNTIVVSTMNKMRDYPLYHNWLLVIIDECLSVQNQNALWTREAFIQSIMSKHLIMMSATFFRTRFEKLYYMLKMLQTGLPETKNYLDTILLETIVSQQIQTSRKWISNIHKFSLSSDLRKKYDQINESDLQTEVKYAKLNSLLTSDSLIQEFVSQKLKKIIKEDRKCLIYARSKEEAQFWSQKLKIPIYPEKGKHCIVTYNDGTYGLNDLIIYDTIIMRPPAPDKLPQIKGRLDRYGNEHQTLYVEYFILENTIEEGLIIRMNIASQFITSYIMPLAKFYDLSINYKNYLKN